MRFVFHNQMVYPIVLFAVIIIIRPWAIRIFDEVFVTEFCQNFVYDRQNLVNGLRLTFAFLWGPRVVLPIANHIIKLGLFAIWFLVWDVAIPGLSGQTIKFQTPINAHLLRGYWLRFLVQEEPEPLEMLELCFPVLNAIPLVGDLGSQIWIWAIQRCVRASVVIQISHFVEMENNYYN